MEEALKQALEIVKAQASVRIMTEEEISSMVLKMTKTIQDALAPLQTTVSQPSVAEQPTPDFGTAKTSIKEKSVVCLECGKSFKIITRRHLAMHDLTPAEYREKHGFPKKAPLACKALQRARKNKMKDMKLWERRTTAKEITEPTV